MQVNAALSYTVSPQEPVQVMDSVPMHSPGVQVERGGRQHLPFGEQNNGLGKFEFQLVALEQVF